MMNQLNHEFRPHVSAFQEYVGMSCPICAYPLVSATLRTPNGTIPVMQCSQRQPSLDAQKMAPQTWTATCLYICTHPEVSLA